MIETLKKEDNIEVVFVVRSVPTLNDVTQKEAKMVGIDKIASVIENGIDGPLPGTILKRCSKEVRELVGRADMIVSKGGGNFDTLGEEKKNLKKNITFMLMCKCIPYSDYFRTQLYHPILYTY